MSQKTVILDDLDHRLLHALQLDGRLPFARFAQLADVSEQTVARRFRRLRMAGVVRVVGLVDPAPLGESSWTVRIQSRPDGAVKLADALARRPDIGWVALSAGGSEIICVTRSRSGALRNELLLQRLPKTAQVNGLSAHAMLHRFDKHTGRTFRAGVLDPEQADTLRSQAIGGGSQAASTRRGTTDDDTGLMELSRQDEALLAELAIDGRAPIVQLAEVTGWTPTRVSRRLEELVCAGLLYFHVDLAMNALGYRSQAYLWLTVGAADLQSTGAEIAEHDVVNFVSAVTGTSNLLAVISCRDNAHLYRYVTDELGRLGALRQLEISPILRRIKQGGSLMDGDRLAVPA
jgi:DNA-binding Lrp family transcriptional regulator